VQLGAFLAESLASLATSGHLVGLAVCGSCLFVCLSTSHRPHKAATCGILARVGNVCHERITNKQTKQTLEKLDFNTRFFISVLHRILFAIV
jgi:hypothetical protein